MILILISSCSFLDMVVFSAFAACDGLFFFFLFFFVMNREWVISDR